MGVRSVLFLILIIFVFACTSYRLNISPVSEETYWRQGRECVGLANDEIEIHVFLERANTAEMAWYVEISNLSDRNIEVIPSKFYYNYWKGLTDTTDRRIYIRNPESEIQRIEEAKEHETNTHLVSSSAELACCCFSFLGSIIQTAEGNHEEAEESRENSHEAMERLREEQDEHEARVEELEAEQDYWENVVLRRTTLMVDETMSGLIEFSTVRSAERIMLNFPINNSLLQFEYKIEWIEF